MFRFWVCILQVREFLVACRRHMPLLARQSMDAGMKFGAMMAGGAGADNKMLEQMEQHMGDYLPQVPRTACPPLPDSVQRNELSVIRRPARHPRWAGGEWVGRRGCRCRRRWRR